MKILQGLAVLAALAASPAALAETLKVPVDYGTIQAAVDAADNGDTVVVAPGEYAELVTIENKSEIEIRGKGWPVILGPDTGFLIRNASYAIRIRGFELDQATVEVIDCLDVTLSKLRIHDVQIALESSANQGLVISKCEFLDVGGDAIVDELSTGLVVAKCRFENIWAYAVNLSPDGGAGTDGAVLSKNRVLFAGSGFALGGTDALVEKNRMEGLLGFGVNANGLSDASRSVIVKNRIQTSGDGGIYGSYSNLVVAKNVLTGGGIGLTGDGHVITGNKLYDSNSHGMLLTGTMTIERNKVRGANDVGIVSQGVDCTIFANAISDTVGAGLDFWGSGCDVSRNRVTGAGTVGILVELTGNVLTANRASGSGDVDLADMSAEGQNEYVDNRFGTIEFNYVP